MNNSIFWCHCESIISSNQNPINEYGREVNVFDIKLGVAYVKYVAVSTSNTLA